MPPSNSSSSSSCKAHLCAKDQWRVAALNQIIQASSLWWFCPQRQERLRQPRRVKSRRTWPRRPPWMTHLNQNNKHQSQRRKNAIRQIRPRRSPPKPPNASSPLQVSSAQGRHPRPWHPGRARLGPPRRWLPPQLPIQTTSTSQLTPNRRRSLRRSRAPWLAIQTRHPRRRHVNKQKNKRKTSNLRRPPPRPHQHLRPPRSPHPKVLDKRQRPESSPVSKR